MREIIVEPTRLEYSASKVESYDSDYQRVYSLLYEEVDKMASVWQGKDNTMFTNKIKEFQDDFRQVSILLRQYAEFLRNTARAYRETQDELYNAASKLRS